MSNIRGSKILTSPKALQKVYQVLDAVPWESDEALGGDQVRRARIGTVSPGTYKNRAWRQAEEQAFEDYGLSLQVDSGPKPHVMYVVEYRDLPDPPAPRRSKQTRAARSR